VIDLLESLPDDERGRLRKASLPQQPSPMLATLTDEPFSSEDWIYERKLDGVRCLVIRDTRGARLLSRNRQRLDESFPELLSAVEQAIDTRLVADGEIVTFDGRVSSFSKLQQRLGVRDPGEALRRRVPVRLYLFDILHLDDRDVTRLPLRRRKQLLKRALDWSEPLRFTSHRNRDGCEWLEEACRKGWEGLIAKRADSAYVQKRSNDWLKFKCSAGQELVIGGFTDPQGSRRGFGALLVGYYEGDCLRYAGRVGTGFDDETLERMARQLADLERETCPFEPPPASLSGVHFVKPELVAEIGFTEWTRDGRLRHPRFQGLRHDKPARDVVREELPSGQARVRP